MTLDDNIMATAESMKGFSPRFVARVLARPIPEVIAMCKRMTAIGVLERYDVAGEYYYRLTAKERASRDSTLKKRDFLDMQRVVNL